MKWIKIFTVGRHTDSSGATHDITRADLERIAARYDPQQREAPLVFGHPKTDDPSFGWVRALKVVGDDLCAQFTQVAQGVRELVEAGRYKYLSIRLGKDMGLRHVGLLGATPPAVPGLGSVEFSDDEDASTYQMAFAEGEASDPGTKPQKEEEDVDPKELQTVNKLLENKVSELEARIKELEAKIAEAEAAKVKAEADASAAENAFAEYRREQTGKAREARFERLTAAGKALPGEKARVLAFAEMLGAAGEMEFAEADGGRRKANAEEEYWKDLESREGHGLFSEQASPEQAAPRKQSADASDINRYA